MAPVVLKIGGHITMMKQEITMTIDIKISCASDLTIKNEVVDLSSIEEKLSYELAGISFPLVYGNNRSGIIKVLRILFDRVHTNFPNHSIWFLIGSSVWQQDTRIVRYHKLWGALSARGINISHVGARHQEMHMADGKLKYFGAARVSDLSIESIATALEEERCTYLISIPVSEDIHETIKAGWTGDIFNDVHLMEFVVENEGLLLWRFGEFDDRETGIVGIGSPSTVKGLSL